MNSVVPPVKSVRVEKSFALAVCAAMIAGACTFLNVYCTQPLLPYFQNHFHATEFAVSLTVSAVTLAVAVTAPFIGLFAETIGRKKVIVPALFGMAITTLLTATATTLPALIFWRFMQGLCVPGVIAVIIAYINEEFPGRTGAVMSAYVSGTVFGGFLGRFLTGLIATHGNWRMAFIVLGVLNLLGAFAVRQWLPLAVNFVPAKHVFHSLGNTWRHLKNPRLLAVCGMGFTILFSLVGAFTYANFHLARPPFNLTPFALGSIFFVYLIGCIVTPLAGRLLDRYGFRRMAVLSVGATLNRAGIDAGLVVAGGDRGADGVFLRHLRLAIVRHRAHRKSRGRRALGGGGIICDVLLCRRKHRDDGGRVVLGEGRLARVRRTVRRRQPGHAGLCLSGRTFRGGPTKPPPARWWTRPFENRQDPLNILPPVGRRRGQSSRNRAGDICGRLPPNQNCSNVKV
jgi:YNFM family putative membrane transporter